MSDERIATNLVTGNVVIRVPRYQCPIHGKHEGALILRIEGQRQQYCLICFAEMLDELGVKQVRDVS